MNLKQYLPWGPILLVCVLGLFNFGFINFIIFGGVGVYSGKKVYDIYKANKVS